MRNGAPQWGERRRHERVDIDSWAEVFDGRLTTFLRAKNLSEGGAFLLSECPFREGQELNVTVALPSGTHALSTRGVVVSHRRDSKRGMGIAFLDLPPQDRVRLRYEIDDLRDRSGRWLEPGAHIEPSS